MDNSTFRKPLRWLHLSDFHLKATNKWSQDVVLKTLLADISSRYPAPNSVDFIFVTGDLAFSGKSEEYFLVEEFLTQLLTVTGVPVDRLMMVPGNHDIDRDTEIDAFHGARCVLRNATEVDKFLGDERRRRTIFQRQLEFRKFSNRVYQREVYSDTSYQHLVQNNFFGLNVSVLLIDSSWLSEGGQTDSHRIIVGEKQLIDLSQTSFASSFTIGLMHHPLDWLAPFELSAIQNLLIERCQLLFRGHVHEESVQTINQFGNQITVLTAGASYESRLSENSYGFGALDLFTGDGQCVIHKYRNDSKTWEKQEPETWILTDQFQFPFTLSELLDVISLHTPPYPNYLACLVGQKVTEVPVRYGDDSMFVAVTDSLCHSTLLALCVRQLRQVIHWRDCWDQEIWRVAIQQLVESYTNAIGEWDQNDKIGSMLSDREEQCGKIVEAMLVPRERTAAPNQAIGQAIALANKGSLQTAASILKRVLAQNGNSDLESLSALRELAKIYLADDRNDEASEISRKVLSFCEADGSDFLIEATCCLNTGDFEGARKYVETAKKMGVPFSRLSGIATRIAGLIGDGQLLMRLRESND